MVCAYINYHLPVAQDGSDVQYPGTAYDKLINHDVNLVDIADVCGTETEFTLDCNGFQFVEHRSVERAFDDDPAIKANDYAEVSDLIKKVASASRANPFSHIIRRQSYQTSLEAAQKAEDKMDLLEMMVLAMFCHVDQSYAGARQVLQDNMSPKDAEYLSKSRWGIINVKRPISATIQREPLAICDARTVSDDDLRPVRAMLPQKGKGSFDSVNKGSGFETRQVVTDPKHKWLYQSEMRVDECLMTKC